MGVGDACHEVGRTRTKRPETDARLAGEPAVDIGHERRALLVASRNKLDRGVSKREEKLFQLLPGEAEDVFGPFDIETVDEEVGCGLHATGYTHREYEFVAVIKGISVVRAFQNLAAGVLATSAEIGTITPLIVVSPGETPGPLSIATAFLSSVPV